ncbi:MAG: hypothetical protein ACPGXK_05235 [Phycisphaerae bacterium]
MIGSRRDGALRWCVWFLALTALFWCGVAQAAIIYVDKDAPGPVHDGMSWETAFRHPDQGFAQVIFLDEVRIAQGVYTPDTLGFGDPRQATFSLPSFATINGGYAGYGETNPDARDIQAFETIFSGDLLGNDVPGGNREDNSRNVVTANLVGIETTFSGFTITAGNSTAPFAPPFFPLGNPGGGLFSVGSLTIESCIFRDNDAVAGGGMFNFEGSPVLTDCLFEDNRASQGGALGLFGTDDPIPPVSGGMVGGGSVAHGTPIVTGCRFENNRATGFAGAVWVDGIAENPIFTDCRFTNNHALTDGGAIWSGGGVCEMNSCLVAGNTSGDEGGGVYADTLINVNQSTFYGNVSGSGGGIFYVFVLPGIFESIFWGNLADDAVGENAQAVGGFLPPLTSYSCIEGWTGDWGGDGNFGDDPAFLPGPDGCYYLDTMLSAAIDAGSGTAVDRGLQFSTTQRDESGDAGTVDVGFHFPQTGRTYLSSDSDRNGVVDLRDIAAMQRCMATPSSPCCLVFDEDGDFVFSQTDLSAFVSAITGP